MCQCRPHTQSYRGCDRDITTESLRYVTVSEPSISYLLNFYLLFLFTEAVALCQCRLITQSHRGCNRKTTSEILRHVAVIEGLLRCPIHNFCGITKFCKFLTFRAEAIFLEALK